MGMLLLSACASSQGFFVSESHWQFQELPSQCEIRSTAQANPQIVWQAKANHQGQLWAEMLIQNASQFTEIKNGSIAKFVLNKVEFNVPLFETSVPHQYAIGYQSLAVLSNFFVTMIPKSQTMTVEINEKKYHYNNRELDGLLDLWTECFIHHFR